MKISGIILHRLIRESISRVLKEEAKQQRFSLQELDSIRSFKGRLEYCRQRLGSSIGSGSSRICFNIGNGHILKLAKNKKGLAQNEFEEETSRMSSAVVDVYDVADNYTWVVEEMCIPAKEGDFERILGIPFITFCDLVRYQYNAYTQSGREVKLFSITNGEAKQLLDQIYDSNDGAFIPNLLRLMGDYGLPCGDLLRVSSYGIVKRDGGEDIVLLDSGLSQEIKDMYYNF